jgi:DNA-binding transcriptional MerR regulator
MISSGFSPTNYSISDVERDTGVPKETLRVWERRYAFPQPGRDGNGERIYTLEQVVRLRLIKRLLDTGYRPGKIMHHSTEELTQLAAKAGPAAPPANLDDPELRQCIALIKQHKMVALRQRMTQLQLQMGLKRFVLEVVAPLCTLVGDAWAAGELAVFEEHLFSELMQSVMRSAILAANQQLGQQDARPRILLTTVPQERHGLGLLMAEALLILEGAHCISLGLQTPLSEVVAAVAAQHADVVGLSFSSSSSPRAVIENVTELENRLGERVCIWAGGNGAALARRQLGHQRVLDLDDIGPSVARWRELHNERQALRA